MTKLQPHQERVINRLTAPGSPHGLIAYHSLGSGKTLTALAAMDKQLAANKDARGLMVVPASLVANVDKEITKHKLEHLRPRVDILSYEKAVKQADQLTLNNYALTVFDEAHRLRNGNTKRVQQLIPIVDRSDKVLLLTGTAGYNHPVDVANLVTIIDPTADLPTSKESFENKYINGIDWSLKEDPYLVNKLDTYIDRYETPINTNDYPTVTRKVVRVPMTWPQSNIYDVVERNIPWEIRAKLRANLPLSLQEANTLNFFSTGVRQVSNTPMKHDVTMQVEDSPKLVEAQNHLAEYAKNRQQFRALVYSNFLESGLDPYKTLVEKNTDIKPLMFTGKLNAADKKKLVDAYNAPGGKKVLLVSSSGGEGLDLKNTNLVQILEPHFNKSKIKQVEGRAIRYKSHDTLPKNQRNVTIEEYRAVRPGVLGLEVIPSWNLAIDDKLADLSDKKQRVVDNIDKLITKR